jgi:hypothetical protein
MDPIFFSISGIVCFLNWGLTNCFRAMEAIFAFAEFHNYGPVWFSFFLTSFSENLAVERIWL